MGFIFFALINFLIVGAERWDAEKNSMFSTPVLVFSRVSGLYWIFRSGIKEFADQSTLTNYKLIEQHGALVFLETGWNFGFVQIVFVFDA